MTYRSASRLQATAALVATAAYLAASAGPAAAFCGFYVARGDAKIFNKASKVVMVRDEDRTVLTMVNDFKAFITSQGVKMDAQAFEADLVFIKAMIRHDIDLALFGVASARKQLIEADPQAQFAVSLFREAEQLTHLARAKAALNEQR